jgi:hypothetical protein
MLQVNGHLDEHAVLPAHRAWAILCARFTRTMVRADIKAALTACARRRPHRWDSMPNDTNLQVNGHLDDHAVLLAHRE